MIRTISPDVAALDILLSKKPKAVKERKLSQLAKKVSDACENRVPCPECGDKGPHEDNGCTRDDLNLCCQSCNTHFEPEPIYV